MVLRTFTHDRLVAIASERGIFLTRDHSQDRLCSESLISCQCERCHVDVQRKFMYLVKTGAFCTNCAKALRNESRLKTNLEKYGVANPMQTEAVRAKTRETNMKRYGGVAPAHSEEVRQKMQATTLERYGVSNIMQTEEHKARYSRENPMKNKDVRTKARLTNLERYGVEYVLQSQSIRDGMQETVRRQHDPDGTLGIRHISQIPAVNEKKKTTTMKNYGVEHPLQSEEIQARRRATMMERWGVEYPAQHAAVMEQIRQTCRQKYGVEHPMQNAHVRQTYQSTCLEHYGVEHTFQAQEVKQKCRESMISRHGVQHALQSDTIREKWKTTCIEKYGAETPFESEQVQEKIRSTVMERYGVHNVFADPEVQNKIQSSIRTLYGVENVMQNADIAMRHAKGCFNRRLYTWPSGKQTLVQGYEDKALDYLLHEFGLTEDNIETDRSNVPAIWYRDHEGTCRRYYVDIFIPKWHLCVEVKSPWTLHLNPETIFLKEKATKMAGYDFQIFVCTATGFQYDLASIMSPQSHG